MPQATGFAYEETQNERAYMEERKWVRLDKRDDRGRRGKEMMTLWKNEGTVIPSN